MAKVYHVTLALELDDDVPDPEKWDWSGLEGTIPGLTDIALLTSEEVPHAASLDEDLPLATVH